MKWRTVNPWQWHRWYAWRPVCTNVGEWVWLMRLERRKTMHLAYGARPYWQYREETI